MYPHLLRGVAVERQDQVGCSDITYIPMHGEFLYLVAVIDRATHFVLPWRLSNTLDAALCVEALEDAPGGGALEVFNTNQDTQFTGRVLESGVKCSIDGHGRCLNDVFIERLWRSMKYESVHLRDIPDGFEAERVIANWIVFTTTSARIRR